ncbi:unnamed protein product, partial [Prorocentrum cordatum]
SWPPPWDPSTASRPQPLGAPVCLLAGCALGNCWCSAQAEECKRWQPGKGTRGTGGGRAGRESGNGNARGHPPLTLPLTCAPAAAVPAPSAPGTPGAPARAGPRISVQSTAALRGGASLGAGAEVESPRAARGGGSRTAGSRQTSRTAPGARVQRASSDPRGTTQPARALHNARDADEMVMAE